MRTSVSEQPARHPVRRLTCRVAALEQVTPDTRIVRLEITAGGPFAFSAGQYARVAFDALPARDYSMANRPDEALLEFHIRDVGDGASRYVARELRPGETVTVEGPFGEAWLRRGHERPILAIAGGSGLAPMKSIVETALASGMRQPIHLYFGARDEQDIYLERHFYDLAAKHRNFRYVPVLSEPSRATGRRSGLVGEAVAADFRDLRGYEAYLAGPPAMVESVMGFLYRRGVRAEDMHADPFYSEAEKAAMAAAEPDRGR